MSGDSEFGFEALDKLYLVARMAVDSDKFGIPICWAF